QVYPKLSQRLKARTHGLRSGPRLPRSSASLERETFLQQIGLSDRPGRIPRKASSGPRRRFPSRKQSLTVQSHSAIRGYFPAKGTTEAIPVCSCLWFESFSRLFLRNDR